MFIGVFHMVGAFFRVENMTSFATLVKIVAGNGLRGASVHANTAFTARNVAFFHVGSKFFVYKHGSESYFTAVVVVNEKGVFTDKPVIGAICGGFVRERAFVRVGYRRLARGYHFYFMSFLFQAQRSEKSELVEREVYRSIVMKVFVSGRGVLFYFFEIRIEKFYSYGNRARIIAGFGYSLYRRKPDERRAFFNSISISFNFL